MVELFPFQKDGVEFLTTHSRSILADEMGLGKTAQVIVALTACAPGPKLVVCPAHLRTVWRDEIKKWTPDSTVQVVEGDEITRTQQLRRRLDWTLVGYPSILFTTEETRAQKRYDSAIKSWAPAITIETDKRLLELAREREKLMRKSWAAIVFDEAHRLRNRKGQTYKMAKRLSSPRVHMLSGTPMPSYGDEIWTLLNLLDRKQFPGYWNFAQKYFNVSHNGFGWVVGLVRNASGLQDVLRPRMLRRTKQQVFPEMPPLTIKQVWVELDDRQRRIYDEMEGAMLTTIDDRTLFAVSTLAQLTRLKQLSISPNLAVDDWGETKWWVSEKVETLVELLDDMNEPFVVFSQFTKLLKYLERRLTVPTFVIHGDVSQADRDAALDRFKRGLFRGLLVQTAAGGEGLTITHAANAFFLDKLWTPAFNEQAQARLHRIGQALPVTVTEILARRTIDEDIESVLRTKNSQVKQFTPKDVHDVVQSMRQRRAK